MRYCTCCVQPDTRPGIYFSEDGVCGACLWEGERAAINWEAREKELLSIADWAKAQSAPYDCVVGVSGGKDSTFQALYARDCLKLRPLLVNADPPFNTDLGRLNMENLKQLGFDVLSLRPNPQVMRKLIQHDFFSVLNISRPCEYALYASSYIVADKFDIPLVIQGENAGQTLGASKDTGTGGDGFQQFHLNTVKQNPLEVYTKLGISVADLYLYRPDFESLKKKGVRALFLSYFVKEWSASHNAQFAINHGLRIAEDFDPYEYGLYKRCYSLDYKYRQVNQFFKYIKYGFGMVTDLACYDIREGRLSREEGAFLVSELDGVCPVSLIQGLCEYLQISLSEFWRHVDTFRGPMWHKDKSGLWKLENPIWKQMALRSDLTVSALRTKLRE